VSTPTDAYLAIVRDLLEDPGAPLGRARRSQVLNDRVLITCADAIRERLDHGQTIQALVGLAGEFALIQRRVDQSFPRTPLTMPTGTDLYA
jgi:hypothetical protein